MNARARYSLTTLLVLLFSVPVAPAQAYTLAPVQGGFAVAQRELDQMLAPIALYPDALLTQILMASTYPAEIVEAARWSRSNPGLAGEQAVRAVERIDWDPSVKSLVAFPQILTLMDEQPVWTQRLGDAFLAQQAQVMDTVQHLRRRAYTAGNLRSNDQFRVDEQGSTFVIRLANPELIYVPYYNPAVIYGAWWWPTHQPVHWAPWSGYHARPGFIRGFAWGPGIRVSSGFFFGAADWHRRSVTIVNVNHNYRNPQRVNRPTDITRNINAANGALNVWQHDTSRRRDVSYRNASVRQPSVHTSAALGKPNVPAAASHPGMRNASVHPSASVTIGRPSVEQRPAAPQRAAHGAVALNHSAREHAGRQPTAPSGSAVPVPSPSGKATAPTPPGSASAPQPAGNPRR